MVELDENNVLIREVWRDNLEDEFKIIGEVVMKYPYVSMDTEYPGIVYGDSRDFNYRTVKSNVDVLKLIQVGLTFADEEGNLPTCGTEKYCLWQFNFEFNPDVDLHNRDSINLLRNSGIDFGKSSEKGFSESAFGEKLMSSGAVCTDGVRWIAFQGSYDFAYLVRLLRGKMLPDTKDEFDKLLNVFFPVVYDVKYLVDNFTVMRGGLQMLANMLGAKRVGASHQAGSDSFLTCCVYFKIVRRYLDNTEPVQHAGAVCGF